MAAGQHAKANLDIDIAQATTLKPIQEISDKLGIAETSLDPYVRTKLKVGFDFTDGLSDRPVSGLDFGLPGIRFRLA